MEAGFLSEQEETELSLDSLQIRIDDSRRPIALVSGGSRGIGRAIVLDLARCGANVAFCYKNDADAALEVSKLAQEFDAQVCTFKVDLADTPSIKKLFAHVRRDLGELDILVNSAGVRDDVPAVMMSESKWQDVIAVNLTAPFLMSKYALLGMCRRRRGCIVNVASLSGLVGIPGQSNYASSKGGLLAMTRVMAREAAPYNVRVNAVCPGLIETDMTAEVSQFGGEIIPLGRSGKPEEVARVVTFLASDSARYMTGSHVVVDGGLGAAW